ncbi:MAG: tetratricopeptide repeat protein [Planctomycetes bacterium]|nr:tetratricopeptide repeat protein [Planctomycetota bacterium]
MRTTATTILLGFLGGFMLSRMRAMPGGDVLSWTGPEHPFIPRILILIVAGIALWRFSGRVSWIVPAAVTLGFAVHGFAFGPAHGLPWIMLALAAIAAFISAPARSQPAPIEAEDVAQPARIGECLGLLFAGAGLSIGLEAIARHVRLFGAGLAQDDTVFATAFLALTALGTAAFGAMASARSARRLSFPVLIAAAAAACFASLSFLNVVADGRGLRPFLERWNLRPADFGSLPWDLLIGSAAFVAPALLVGAALAGARGRGSLASAVIGAGAGLAVVDLLFSRGNADLDQAALFSAHLVPIATLIAIGGAALALLSETQRKPRARYIALLLLVPCGIPGLVRTTKPIMVLSPWEGHMVLPFVVIENAAGLVTVEPSVRNFRIATLNRRLLTPDRDTVEADAQRINDSFALLPQDSGPARVLFVGQLTALRAATLALHSPARIDRTAAWHKSMAVLESQLFAREGQPSLPVPEGDVISLATARERIASGAYDLVIAVPFPGDAPAIDPAPAPATTTIVRWLALDEPLAQVANENSATLAGSDLVHPVVLSADGLDQPAFGIVTNGTLAPHDSPRRVRAFAFERDDEATCPWQRVRSLWGVRADRARASTFRALERATPGALASALSKFYSAQVPSSPFESPSQRVELYADALAEFERAAREEPLDPFLRSAWNWIARVLIEKRDVTLIDTYLAPLAAAHPDWSMIEIALAYADLEGLEPDAAILRLQRIVERENTNARAWFALAESYEIDGQLEEAVRAFRRTCELVPDRVPLRRRLAMALCRVEDPEGRRLVQELLTANPADEDLKVFLEPGPPPPPPTRFTPAEGH